MYLKKIKCGRGLKKKLGSLIVLNKKKFVSGFVSDGDIRRAILKKINIEKDFDRVIASHNGYQKKYGYLHEREIKFFKKKQLFIGKDSLIADRKATKVNFGIRFHVHPETKVVKTQNSTTVLLSMSNGDGWKFTCSDYELIIETGIYLGNKNKLNKNENIFISGIAEQKDLFINWTFEKIS